MPVLDHKGILFILSSPSGAGKTTMASLLTAEDKNIVRSISATTRPTREGEVHGEDYFFLDEKEFQNLCESDMMLEYAAIFGYYYGTPRKYVKYLLDSGKDVLCCIDWQGSQQISAKTETVNIFLLPPSLKELRERLHSRSLDRHNVIERRIKEAKNEIVHYNEYDYVVVNNKIEEAIKELRAIVKSERAKVKNKKNLEKFIKELVVEEE